MIGNGDVRVDQVSAAAYEIPTSQPEADGTLAWTSTTLIVARVAGGGRQGIGYTYAGAACTPLFDGALDPHGGVLRPDLSRPGLGLDFKDADADRFRVA